MDRQNTPDLDSHSNLRTRSWVNRLDDSSVYNSSQSSTPLHPIQLTNPLRRRSDSLSSTSSSSISNVELPHKEDWESNELRSWAKDEVVTLSGPSPIQSLPTELLIHIFQHLPDSRDLVSAMLVSKSWCLTAFPLVWQRPLLSSITQFAAFARVLSMTKTLLPYSTIVRRLVLNGFSNHLTDELFAHVSICRNLERLTIPSAVNLTSRSLKNVFGKLHELVAIDLSGVEAVDDAVLHVIINNCPPLQGLSLCQCPKITDEGILAVASKLQGLRRIKLDDCKSLTDRSIVALTRGCPLLMEFALARMPQLSNDTTTAIFFNLRALRDLRMPDNELISAIPHLFSFAWLNETQVLKAVGAYPWYLTGTPRPKAMARQCPRPPNLDMALVRPVTTSFDHLRVVDFNSCKGLNDQAVDNLIDNARQLRSITLTKCVKLTDATVESITKLGKHLHHLHLGHVSSLTDTAITRLAQTCTRLRYIDLANCSLLTDVSVVALASNLPKLRRVGLVKVTNITDKGIQALAERYSTMERLHLSYCDKVSVKTVAFLLNRLPLLTHLSVTGISVFRTAELQQFSREPPDSFNLHQRETFCVYSGQGVAALRSYLNSQMTESASEGSSTRRGSESSTSSSAPVAYRGGLDELAVTFQAATPGWEQSSSRALDSVVDVAGNQSSEAGASEPRSAGGAPLNPDLSFLSLSEAASHPDNTGSTRGRPTRSESTRLV